MPANQLDRMEQLLTEIRDALRAQEKAAACEPQPFGYARSDAPYTTGGTNPGINVSASYTETAPPYQQDTPSFSAMQGMIAADDPRSSVDPRYPIFSGMGPSGPLMAAIPLPPARPAGSEPDLDTALTMGMEAPAPVVAPDRKGPPSLYPKPDLTPGVIFPQITAADVSVPGYAKRVRAVPDAMKRAVYLRYGLDPAKHETAEVDHYVSLCLGGTNDIENLWPEPAVTPDAPGQVGFHEKDAVEFWLHQQVCNKSMSLQAAQDAIRGDWYATYLSIPHSHLAMMSAMLDAPEQP